jgi:hypothetical protein
MYADTCALSGCVCWQVALCVYALRWTQRRSEALTLLAGLRRSAVDEAERARIDQLVAEPWFCEQ